MVLMVNLDCSKAFDNVDHNILIHISKNDVCVRVCTHE